MRTRKRPSMFARTGLLLRAEFKRMCVLGQNQITRLNKTMSLVLLIVCRFFLQHFSQLKGVVRRDFVSVCTWVGGQLAK